MKDTPIASSYLHNEEQPTEPATLPDEINQVCRGKARFSLYCKCTIVFLLFHNKTMAHTYQHGVVLTPPDVGVWHDVHFCDSQRSTMHMTPLSIIFPLGYCIDSGHKADSAMLKLVRNPGCAMPSMGFVWL